jgi:hypothetical protein
MKRATCILFLFFSLLITEIALSQSPGMWPITNPPHDLYLVVEEPNLANCADCMKLQGGDGYYFSSTNQGTAWAILRNMSQRLLNQWLEAAYCTDIFNVILVAEGQQAPIGEWSITIKWDPYLASGGEPLAGLDEFPSQSTTALIIRVNSDKHQVWWTLRNGDALNSIPSPPTLPITHAGLESTLSHELGHALGLGHHAGSSNVMYAVYNNKIHPRFDERKTLYELYHPGKYFYYGNVTNQFGDDPANQGGRFLYNGDWRYGGTAQYPATFMYTSDNLPTLTALDNQKFPSPNGPTYYYYQWWRDGGDLPLATWTPQN